MADSKMSPNKKNAKKACTLPADVQPKAEEERNREEFKRAVRDVLNKLTPENLQPLVEQIIKLPIDNKEKANDVVTLVLEKIIEQPDLSALYASLCKRLAKEVFFEITYNNQSQYCTAFRSALLDKVQHEFNVNIANLNASINIRLNSIVEKLKTCQDPAERLQIQAQLEEDERRIRLLDGSAVILIGEMYLLSMLTNGIIRSCITKLLDPTSEDKLEYLCKLLTIVGKKYESTPADGYRSERLTLDSVILKMQSIVDEGEGSNISNRIRLMMKTVIELRNQW